MATNEVRITVTSENKTKAGFDSAKADAEKAGSDAGFGFSRAWDSKVQGEFSKHKLASWLDPAVRDAENAGDAAGQGFLARLLSRLGGGVSGGLTGAGGALSNAPFIGGLIPEAAGSNPYVAGAAIAGIATAAGALLVEVTGLVSGFAAATAGLGAFGLLAIPTFKQLSSDASGLVTQWQNLQTAQDKLAVAQQNFNADPTKANKTALASAQKGVTTAQNDLQAAQMGLGQDAGPAATGVLQLRDAYQKLSSAIQPQVFQVLNQALKIANTLLPDMKPFAQAAGSAIDGLLGKVNTFFQSADFKKWLASFEKLVAPSITAIGDGIGKVTTAVGQLFTKMSAKDVVNAINVAFTIISGVIDGVRIALENVMKIWDTFTRAARDVRNFLDGTGGPGSGAPPSSTAAKAAQARGAARAGGGPAAGWTLVGEMGPELVNLPAGSYVHPAGSFGLPGGGYGGSMQLVMNWGSPQTQALVRMLWPNLQLEVRNRGGGGKNSAQIALGQVH